MSLEFKDEGVRSEVHRPVGMEFRKTITGIWVLVCRCGTFEIPLGDRWKEPTNPSSAGLLPLELVKNGKMANEIINKAPRDNLMKFLREFSRYQKIREKGSSDQEVFTFDLTCDICHSIYHLTTIMTNPVPIEKPITLREALKTIPIKRDGFTLKALARIAVVQKFDRPEAYIDDVEKMVADATKIDAYLQKVQGLAKEGRTTFQSGRMSEFISILESDLATVPDQLKREMEREIDTRIDEMLKASFVNFSPDEESLPEKIKNKLSLHNEAVLAT